MKFNKPLSPDYQGVHRIALGLWGTGCSALRLFVKEAAATLPPGISLAFLDASHENVNSDACSKFEYYHNNDFIEIYGKAADKNSYSWQQHEFVLVNAHHHHAEMSCLIIDGKKPYKPMPEQEGKTHYVWLKEGMEAFEEQLAQGNFPIQKPICFYESRGHTLKDVLMHHANQKRAPLHALILTGGMSTRMGSDKSEIDYHGQAQREFLAAVMEELNLPYSLSCNHEQYLAWGARENLLPDRFQGFGPLSGMLTAFCEFPGKALLVLACDLPYMDEEAIKHLIQSRSFLHKVSAYRDASKSYADPLAAIWEPETYPFLLQYLSRGNTCPRRAIEHLSLLEVTPRHPDVLLNANTPQERDAFRYNRKHEHQG